MTTISTMRVNCQILPKNKRARAFFPHHVYSHINENFNLEVVETANIGLKVIQHSCTELQQRLSSAS